MVKSPLAKAGDTGDMGSIPLLGISPKKEMATIPVFLPGKFHGQRSLVGVYGVTKSWTRLCTHVCKGKDRQI